MASPDATVGSAEYATGYLHSFASTLVVTIPSVSAQNPYANRSDALALAYDGVASADQRATDPKIRVRSWHNSSVRIVLGSNVQSRTKSGRTADPLPMPSCEVI